MDWVTSHSSRRRWPGFTPFALMRPGFGADWGHLTLTATLGLGPRRGRAGVNTRARRVRGVARGPWRAPHPAVAGVHAVCAHAARIWGGLGPFGTYGLAWPRAPERPGRREHAGPAGRRRGPRPLARAASGGGRGSRRLRPCCPDLGRIGAIWHLRPHLA